MITNKKNINLFLYLALLVNFMSDFVAAASLGVVFFRELGKTIVGEVAKDQLQKAVEHTNPGIVLSIILFLTGAYFCILGGVRRDLTMAIVGFYVGSNLNYIIMTNANPDFGKNSEWILLSVSIVVGILIMFCIKFVPATVCLLGALFGYTFALWLLSWNRNGMIESDGGRAVLIVVFVIVGTALMYFKDCMFIIAPPFIGSFAFFCGIDIYLQSGLMALVAQTLNSRDLGFEIKKHNALFGFLGGCLGSTIFFALAQYCYYLSENDVKENEVIDKDQSDLEENRG